MRSLLTRAQFRQRAGVIFSLHRYEPVEIEWIVGA
jgi:hypothetical protein